MIDTVLLLAALSLIVTLINTVIVQSTRAAVAELRAEMFQCLARRGDLTALEKRVREVER